MKHLTILALCCISLSVCAQQDSLSLAVQDSLYRVDQEGYFAHILVQSHYDGTSIRLRWAPDAAGGWMNGNVNGYRVERLDLGNVNTTEIADTTGFRAVGDSVRKALTIPGWQALHDQYPNDTYLMVAGEMIHTSLLPENIGAVGSMMQAAQDLKERFSFALLSCDLSWQAAEGAALGLVDRNVQTDHGYIYRVTINKPNPNYPIDTGYVVVNTSVADVIERPIITEVQELDSLIQLKWPRAAHDEHFTAYIIERSDDNGKTWKRRNKLPFVSFSNPELPATQETIVYTDSIAGMYKLYQYRVIGITPFGLQSAPSDVKKAMGRDNDPPPSPFNVKATEKKAGQITVTWEYPKGVKDLAGFHVLRGTGAYEGYGKLVDQLLPATTRSFVDMDPPTLQHNYYLIVAMDTANNPGMSMSAWGNVADSIPPAAPKGLQGRIDTNGVVTISWNMGKEPDVYGYYIFFKNQEDHIGSRLNPQIIRDTTYVDTVSMNTLTEEVFYEVVALDMNYNNSKRSTILKLERPDLRAPASAMLVDYKVDEKGVWLKYATSSSQDVVEHLLLRRAVGAANYDTISHIPLSKELTGTYTDKDTGKPGHYEYAIIAKDDAGLFSQIKTTFKLRMLSRKALPTIEKLAATFNKEKNIVELKWEYAEREGITFVVMKAEMNGNFTRVKMLPHTARIWNDRLVKSSVEYRYFIQVVDPKGQDSEHSEKVSVRL